MGAGSMCLAVIAWIDGGFAATFSYGANQRLANFYLGAIASSLSFFLWVYALERTTPMRVPSTLTIKPVTASVLAGQEVKRVSLRSTTCGLKRMKLVLHSVGMSVRPSIGGRASCGLPGAE